MAAKVAFISCVNNDKQYIKCLAAIKALDTSEMTVETLAIRAADSIAAAYNRGSRLTDAEYKVYLHQDVQIINPHFLSDVDRIFQSNPNIGLIGMYGCTRLPRSGIWWEGKEIYGKVYHPTRDKAMAAANPKALYRVVTAVDGFLMVTRFDLPWREDIIDGFHFYDVSQCLEYCKRGYLVVVPRQETPWCFHPSPGSSRHPDYFRLRDIFLREYLHSCPTFFEPAGPQKFRYRIIKGSPGTSEHKGGKIDA